MCWGWKRVPARAAKTESSPRLPGNRWKGDLAYVSFNSTILDPRIMIWEGHYGRIDEAMNEIIVLLKISCSYGRQINNQTILIKKGQEDID